MATQTVTVRHRGEEARCDLTAWHEVADDMIERLGPWVPGESKVIPDALAPEAPPPPPPAAPEAPSGSALGFSDFGPGGLVVDDRARERIQGMTAAINASGVVKLDEARQLYGTGTRMAAVGYSNQQKREDEWRKLSPIREVANRFITQVEQEKRRDLVIRADEVAAKLAINGKLTFDGYALRDHAVRGLLARLGSPATRYVVGLKERIADPAGDAKVPPPQQTLDAWKAADKAALLDCLIRECKRYGGRKVKFRVRDGLRDIFATTSPDYAAADAPATLGRILPELPDNARGAYSYDPTTTTWQLRASVFTPTPVQEQAVGEPFEGYAAFTSADGGQRMWTGGGGLLILACLNAGIYEAESKSVRRMHRGKILVDVRAMARDAVRAITVLVDAWGQARTEAIAAKDDAGKLIPLEVAIPGFYRHVLNARRGELVGVLPGRSEKHVSGLAATYLTERRDRSQITRADLANGWTRYVQNQPGHVQRDAERAIGAWMVNKPPVRWLAQ